MTNDLWQTIRPVSVEASRWNYIVVADVAGKFSIAFRLSPFVISPVPWLGASFIVYEMRFNINKNFSFRLPVFPPKNPSYVLAVRWSEGTKVHRYKFWENISEILHYPRYAGQKIGANFVLEVWSIKNATKITVDDSIISTGILINREDCCQTPYSPYSLYAYSYLFAPMRPNVALPITFTEPLNATFQQQPPPLTTEDGIWIITEDGKIIVLG